MPDSFIVGVPNRLRPCCGGGGGDAGVAIIHVDNRANVDRRDLYPSHECPRRSIILFYLMVQRTGGRSSAGRGVHSPEEDISAIALCDMPLEVVVIEDTYQQRKVTLSRRYLACIYRDLLPVSKILSIRFPSKKRAPGKEKRQPTTKESICLESLKILISFSSSPLFLSHLLPKAPLRLSRLREQCS